MGSARTSTTSSSGPAISAGNGNPGRSIFSDVQWLSLARSLQLSGREREILQCIFEDQTEAVIARRLGISAHTVHTHLERLYRKLGVGTRCAAVIRVFSEYVSRPSSRRRRSLRRTTTR